MSRGNSREAQKAGSTGRNRVELDSGNEREERAEDGPMLHVEAEEAPAFKSSRCYSTMPSHKAHAVPSSPP